MLEYNKALKRNWAVISLVIISFWGGCGVFSQQPTPTIPVLTVTPTIMPSPSPTPSPTPNPTPNPTNTPEARAEIILLVVDCTWKFCPPEEMEQAVIGVIGKPGIHTAASIDELHVRVVYNPNQLTAEQAAELFADTTSLEVEETE